MLTSITAVTPAACVSVVSMAHLACSCCRDEGRRRGPDLRDASSEARGACRLGQPFGLAATRSATLLLAIGLGPGDSSSCRCLEAAPTLAIFPDTRDARQRRVARRV